MSQKGKESIRPVLIMTEEYLPQKAHRREERITDNLEDRDLRGADRDNKAKGAAIFGASQTEGRGGLLPLPFFSLVGWRLSSTPPSVAFSPPQPSP